jgi:hypothetical protein
MAEERSIENGKRARQFMRSSVFRICSWLSLVLAFASLLVHSHRIWFSFAAAVVWFGAALPVLIAVPYRRRLDIHNPRDRQFLLFAAVYLALVLLGAWCCVVYIGSRH